MRTVNVRNPYSGYQEPPQLAECPRCKKKTLVIVQKEEKICCSCINCTFHVTKELEGETTSGITAFVVGAIALFVMFGVML